MAQRSDETVGVIAQGLFIRGELHGEDDLIIEGRVEGTITLKKHLIVESTGVIMADVRTENITVKGEINGNMTAADKVTIHADARVLGDITAPRVEVEDGAHFRGHIEMSAPEPLPAALPHEAARPRLVGEEQAARRAG